MSEGLLASISRAHTVGEHGTGRLQSSHTIQSFPRLESPRSSPRSRSRASTLQSGIIPENMSPEIKAIRQGDTESTGISNPRSPQSVPEGFDELPIELVSLTDRFIESLTTAKIHNTPPSADKLSDIFQEFYVKAASHISTHISALSSRQYHGVSLSPSMSSKTSISAKDARRLRSTSSKDSMEFLEKPAPEQQMLTPQEISERRKARRLLEQKGLAFEEAIERRVCERLYDRIWRHRSTLDEVRDEKLRSRTAALALVGIGLEDLGITFDKSKLRPEQPHTTIEAQVEEWISKAREGLLKMNDAKCPLGKLQHLAATHKCIVELLTTLHQSSSSADEILPTLIYTLITTPPEGINVISNLHFTQRFRAASKIDGEMAYCLTNLEAAISFLETVDLASLRSDELLEGPPKSCSRPSTPRDDDHREWPLGTPTSVGGPFNNTITPATVNLARSDPVTVSHPLQPQEPTKLSYPISPPHSRRLSNLFRPPTSAVGAASDAVRTSADQGLKNIGNTLENSFQFLFGRLKEQNVNGIQADAEGGAILPRTLDDALKLVNPKPAIDEEGSISGASSLADHTEILPDSQPKLEDRILGIFAGHRDRSADSAQSSGSGKRVAFVAEMPKSKEKAGSPTQNLLVTGASQPAAPASQHEYPHAGNVAVESMRNLGNTLNPLNRFAGMNMMRGFGRSSSTTTIPAVVTPPLPLPAAVVAERPVLRALDTTPGNDKTIVDPKTQVAPPIQRFLDVVDASDLRVGEVQELLRDYQRLARELRESSSD